MSNDFRLAELEAILEKEAANKLLKSNELPGEKELLDRLRQKFRQDLQDATAVGRIFNHG